MKEFANAYSISENDLEHETPLAKNLLRKGSQLPTSLEQFIVYSSLQSCVLFFIQFVNNRCNSFRRQRFKREKFFKNEICENISQIP